MGMVAYFTALSPQQLEELEDDPDDIEAFLFPADGDEEPPNTVDVDKIWHGIHYLLTGSAGEGTDPLAQAILGGKPVGEDLGYGPARVLRPDKVAAVATALAAVTPDDLRERFDPEDMEAQQIYLAEAFADNSEEEIGYLLDGFATLQAFYRDAAARGDAVIQWIA